MCQTRCDCELKRNVLQEQEKKGRLRGLQAHKANIVAAKSVARLMRSSLGPKGMDKMMQSPDGDILISERPATVANMLEHPRYLWWTHPCMLARCNLKLCWCICAESAAYAVAC